MIVLGIETSCDDTSMSLYSEDLGVIGIMTAAQLIHDRFGGVVPEIASREHVRTISAVYSSLLEISGVDQAEIGGIAETSEALYW